jgi:thiamine-phosphate pyrophosphorylase
MESTQPELSRRFFELLIAGEIEAALGLTSEDVVIDRSNSNAPWGRAISRGREQARDAYRSFQAAWEEVGGVRWEQLRDRRPGGGRLVVETGISGRGPSTGLSMDARGAWLLSAADERISEAILFQSFDEALLAGRRRAIGEARLYFVCEARPHGADPRPLLEAALRGGVDMIQLRDKEIDDEYLVAAAGSFRELADRHGALFFVNDRPDLVASCDADGVHVGQDDVPVAEARGLAGPAAAVGLSTHSPEQFDAAVGAAGDDRPDQISAGPVWETPTKEGRPAAGLELIRHAAALTDGPPWFAIGGIDASNVGEVAAAGARRIVVVRAIRDAADPEAAARELRAALDRSSEG